MKGKPAEAEKLVDDVLAAEPKSAEAIALKGDILSMRGDADGAIQRFDEALALDPNNVTARLARANVYLNRGDYAAVDKDLKALSKGSPQDFRANYLRALEYVKKQNFAAADPILEWLSSGFCEFAGRILCPGTDEIPAEQYGQASEAIAKYVARVPENPAGARLAATIALSSGNAPTRWII